MKRSTMVAAFVAACAGCIGNPDTPMQSGDPLPIGPAWTLENLGVPRVIQDTASAGQVIGYTRQLILTSPVSGVVRLSGHVWIRLGSNEHDLQVPTADEARAAGITCDLYSSEDQTHSFGQSCRMDPDGPQGNSTQGCEWAVPVTQGRNDRLLQFECTLVSDGRPRAFTVGVLDMVACPQVGPCRSITIDGPLIYQGGGAVPRPQDGLIIYMLNVPRH